MANLMRSSFSKKILLKLAAFKVIVNTDLHCLDFGGPTGPFASFSMNSCSGSVPMMLEVVLRRVESNVSQKRQG